MIGANNTAILNARCINCVPYSVAAIFVTSSKQTP